jgi:hypothetical protein
MWQGGNPDGPNWQGSADEEGIGEIELYTVSTVPPTYTNPRIGIRDANEVDLPRAYNDFNVNNLTAQQINGNPNFDASNWWRYMAKGNVTAQLLPPPPVPPTTQTRQYDLTGWKDIKCTNLTCETDPLFGGTMTCAKGVIPLLVGTDADFSTSEIGLADVNIYGANNLAADNALYVEGGTTLTGGGIVHGVTIGALRAGPIDTVRIDVLPTGMTLTSATFIGVNAVGAVEMAAGGASSVSAGGALSLAGGSFIEYNSDQHYFRNTSAGNDFTDIFVGNIHGADGGSAPLTLSENRGINITSNGSINVTGNGSINVTGNNVTTTTGGVNITNAKTINLYSEVQEWNYDTLYDVNAVVYSNNQQYKALVKNTGLSPELTTILEWLPDVAYVTGNIAYVVGVASYRCINNVTSSTPPNADFTNWAPIGSSQSTSIVWDPVSMSPFASTITGDLASTLTNGSINTKTINLLTSPTFDEWDSVRYYTPGSIVHRSAFDYLALIGNASVPPNGTQAPAWVSGDDYVFGNFVTSISQTWQCIKDITNSTTTPNGDLTHWNVFPLGMSGIWEIYDVTPVVSTIQGDANSKLTIGEIETGTLVVDTSIETLTLKTNSISPLTGSTVGISGGNLTLGDNDITGVTKLTTRELAAPAGAQIELQSDLNGQSEDGTLRSMFNMNLVQTRCETGADASVDFVLSDGTTLAMEISVDEAANTATIEADVPLTIQSANALNITATGTGIADNINITSAREINLNTLTNSVRVQANNVTATAENTINLATVDNELILTATNSNIELNAGGLIKANADVQLNNSRYSIVDTTDYAWVRWWYEGFSYSLDLGASWIAIAADWWKYAAQGTVNFNDNAVENIRQINGHNLYTYGQYYMLASQYPATANTPEQVLLSTEFIAFDTTLDVNSIKILKSGRFQVTIDGCVEHLSGPAATLDVWLRVNGNDQFYTTAHTRVSSSVEFSTISNTHMLEMEENDLLEVWFATSNTDTGFSYAPALTTPYDAPERPAFSVSILLIA